MTPLLRVRSPRAAAFGPLMRLESPEGLTGAAGPASKAAGHLPDRLVLVVSRSPSFPVYAPSLGLLGHSHNMTAGFPQEQVILKRVRQKP